MEYAVSFAACTEMVPFSALSSIGLNGSPRLNRLPRFSSVIESSPKVRLASPTRSCLFPRDRSITLSIRCVSSSCVHTPCCHSVKCLTNLHRSLLVHSLFRVWTYAPRGMLRLFSNAFWAVDLILPSPHITVLSPAPFHKCFRIPFLSSPVQDGLLLMACGFSS